MRVFNVNKAIGFASSGVEYAQKYRHHMLQRIEWLDDYYVFTDYIATNLCVFTDIMEFPRESVIWIYNFLTGRKTVPCSLTIEGFEATIAQEYNRNDSDEKFSDLLLKDASVRYRIWKTPDGFIDRVDTIVSNMLERVDHYDESLNNVEYYQDGQLIRRVFYTGSGAPALEQFYQNGEITQTIIDGTIISGRSLFFQIFFRKLLSDKTDVVIVDRALDVIDGIYPVIGDHRLYTVVHAEHYDLKHIEDDVLLWNNHYEYVFSHPDRFDGIIVSTDRQKKVLARQLSENKQTSEAAANVVCIPVGTVKTIHEKNDYDRFSVITSSRLAAEKHIDILIKAVIEARKAIPEIRLDIYGEGNRTGLEELIAENGSGDYIALKGHHKLDGVYSRYALFATASTSEGFGLSLLEAISEGLPIVGFDVDYGNREMVEQGVNGLLFPHENSDRDILNLAGGIVEILSCTDMDGMRAMSREKARVYTSRNVQKMWELLLREGE